MVQEQERLIQTLVQHAELFPRATAEMNVRLIETHISYVFLVGSECVFKIKKCCNLEFLDFTRVLDRLKFCNRELELNSRFSPMIYKRVLAIVGDSEHPRFVELDDVENQSVFEYALEMRQFDINMQLDRLLERGELNFEMIEELGLLVAKAHENAPTSRVEDNSYCKSIEILRVYF
jgi:aminoglycoside phosphotransferase family enzyme